MTEPLLARFDAPALDGRLRWHNEPSRYRVDSARGRLVVEPEAGTDFWQRTHYGFRVDSGHFLHVMARGNFVLTTAVTCFPVHQYDQAGLMLRISADCWLKASVELEPDEPHSRLGAVVTNGGYSDWSTQPMGKQERTFWFRARAEATAIIVDSSLDGQHWEQIRMAHLTERTPSIELSCGLYACSPKGAGFRAEFHHLELEPRP
ncbi:MAG: DUF1349 domain-containing protein [Myxococcales bacterium]|nr:MAG: DUF1349 domain-containing protein [Myxococcales bacterium]